LFVGINYGKDRSTINISFLASENRVANGVFANVSSVAGNRSVDTTSSRNTSISCANSRVVTSNNGIKRSEDTTSSRITRVICASIVIIADTSGLDALVICGVARVNDTFVVRVADFISSSAETSVGVADVNLAVNLWALDIVN